MAERGTIPHLSRISTNWDLLHRAQRGQGQAAQDAQQQLLERYWGAVYRYLLAAVRDRDAAEDLAQEFALRFVRGDFHKAEPERGRFRDLLKTVLYHLVVDHHRRQQAQPRPLPDEPERAPVVGPPEVQLEQAFEEHWREELLERAWQALEQAGHSWYRVLHWRAENPKAPAAELAEQLTRETGRKFTEVTVRQTLHRARVKFAEFLLDEVARSLPALDPPALEEELRDLKLLVYCQPALDRRAQANHPPTDGTAAP